MSAKSAHVGVFENADSGCLGYVLKRSIAPVAIEPIGKACRLANVKIVEAIVVDVTDRNAVVPVNIDAGGAVENRSPVVRAVKQLSSVGGIATERLLRLRLRRWESRIGFVSHPAPSSCVSGTRPPNDASHSRSQ